MSEHTAVAALRSAIPEVTTDDITAGIQFGDLAKLTEIQRVRYYLACCQSAGLNPLTRPFTLMRNQAGELFLYANKVCSEQLRKRDKISVTIVSRIREDDLYTVIAKATAPDGREEESMAIVGLMVSVKTMRNGREEKEERLATGQTLGNLMMRCETKAKNRVTMAIAGLGFATDEADAGPAQPVNFDPRTGEITAPTTVVVQPPPGVSASALLFDAPSELGSARSHLMMKIDALMAEQGLSPAQQAAAWEKWQAKYPDLTPAVLTIIYDSLEERAHTLYAEEVDAAMVREDMEQGREPGDEDEEEGGLL